MARILDEENEEIGSRYDVLPEITKSDEASALSAALLYDPEDTPAARMRKKMIGGMSGWSNAGTGVRLMWLGQMTLLILMITIFLGGWIARWVLELAGPPDESSLAVLATSILIIEIVILIAMAVGCILTLVGQTFCFGAPAAKGARLFAILSLAMILLGVVTIVFGSMTAGVGLAVLANAGVGAIMGAIVAVLGTIMILAGYVLFLFFIRAVGICLKQEGLIHGAYGLMFTMGFLIAVQIIGAIILNATGSTAVAGSVRDGKPVVQDTITGATIFGCFVGILGFIVWIWFIVLLGQTRNAIRNFLDYRG